VFKPRSWHSFFCVFFDHGAHPWCAASRLPSSAGMNHHVLRIDVLLNQRQFALTKFYGIGNYTAHRICARLQIHNRCKIKQLTPNQITALASFLSSPSTTPPPPRFPLASPDFVPPPPGTPEQGVPPSGQRSAMKKLRGVSKDPLANLKIESDLRKQVRENIAFQRMIGSYVGKRHAMHFPVRGQNTQTNAKTARKLNRIDRYA
jgi:small subunit ribosomal protein S13